MRRVFHQTTFTAPTPQFSRDITSRDFPFDSGTKKVNSRPKRLIKPSTISELRTPIPAGYPTIAPSFPDAADIRRHADLNLAGKMSAVTKNVVALVHNLLSRRLLSASSRIQFGFPCESSGSKGWPKQI